MTNFTPDLLTPPREEEIVYPYRKVWRSIVIESFLLISIVIGVYGAFEVVGINFSDQFIGYINGGLALAPMILWLVFSLWRERFVQEPRPQLLTIFIITALVANAVNIPLLENYIDVSKWLSPASAIDRIIGYTITVGIIQEFTKYLIIRYFAWNTHFRIRQDSIAYGMAAAIGYITVVNLHFAFTTSISPSQIALRILHIYVIHIVATVIMSYGLAEIKFNPRSLLLLPFTLILGATTTGIAIPTRAGLINAGFFLGISGQSLLFDLIFSVVFLVIPLVIVAFLYDTAETREREAQASGEA